MSPARLTPSRYALLLHGSLGLLALTATLWFKPSFLQGFFMPHGGEIFALEVIERAVWVLLILGITLAGLRHLSKTHVGYFRFEGSKAFFHEQAPDPEHLEEGAVVRCGWHWLPWLIQLNIREGSGATRKTLVWPDSTDAETHRRLRILAREQGR